MENQVILALKNNKLLNNILFDELNLDNIKGQLITKSEGEILFRDSDDATSLYLVVSGEINILKKRETQKTESEVVGENDFFGADGFLQQGKRKSTAVILRDSYIIALSKPEVDNLIEQNPQILNNLIGSGGEDMLPGGEVPVPTGDTGKADLSVEEPAIPPAPEVKPEDGLSLEGFDDIEISEQQDDAPPSAGVTEQPAMEPSEPEVKEEPSLDDLKIDDIPDTNQNNDITLDENLPSDKIEITDDDINLDVSPLDDFQTPASSDDEKAAGIEKPDEGLDLSELSIGDITIDDEEGTPDLSMDDLTTSDAEKTPELPAEDAETADENKSQDMSFSDLVAEASDQTSDQVIDNTGSDKQDDTLDLSLDDLTSPEPDKTPDMPVEDKTPGVTDMSSEISLDDLTPPEPDISPDFPVEEKTPLDNDKNSGISFDDLAAAGDDKMPDLSLDDLKIPDEDLGSNIDLSGPEPEPEKEITPDVPASVTPVPDIVDDDINPPVGEVEIPPEEKTPEEIIPPAPPPVQPTPAAEEPPTAQTTPPESSTPAPVIRKAKFSGENSFELLEKINDAAQLVNSNIKIDDVLQNIVAVATDLTNADRGTLYLLEKEKNELWSKIALGNEFKEIKLKVGNGIAGWVAQKGEIINLDNAQEDSRFNVQFDKTSGYVTKSMLCFPIKDRNGDICGVLQLLNSKNGKFSKVDEELLEALSIHAAMALQNAELVEQLLKGERIFSLGKMANFLIQDIKKPVMVSKRYTEHLRSKELPEESMKVIDLLLEQLDHIAELVNSTSSYSEGQIVSRSQLRKLNEVLEDFVKRMDSFVKSRNCTLVSDLEKDVNVQISEKQLYQAFQHLVKNACDAMPEGGEVAVFTEVSENRVTINVKDAGLGIPETLHEKIFEPFMSHGKKEGTGLGLSITKKIIEEHGGSITLESDIGEGAKFIISLPVASSQ